MSHGRGIRHAHFTKDCPSRYKGFYVALNQPPLEDVGDEWKSQSACLIPKLVPISFKEADQLNL